MARYNTERPVTFELEDKQQNVPCIIWHILILKELAIVYLKYKFNWAPYIFICSNTHSSVFGRY